VHPDYALKGRLVRQSGEVIEFSDASYHHRPVYQHQPFYERLWSQPVGRARPDDAAQALTRRLRDDLRQALPDYMVPAAFTLLADLPYLPNGKVDRQRLPVPEASRLTSAVAYVAPQSEIEQKIAAVWQALLPVEHVGIHDNFFDLGGNSLLMIQAYNQLTQIFSQDLLMVDLFKYSTVSMLAEHFSQAQQGSPDQPAGMAEPAEKQVLTQAQVATRKTATSRQRDLRRSHRNRLAGGN
ncbi:MAG: phosphopantetheine-binding protein, partial [Cyanobacteria bacterium P01_H01_bin.121]